MDDVGVEEVHGRRLKLFQLSSWTWEEPADPTFTLFVAADASASDSAHIRRFAADAISAGCGAVCAWGAACELVHHVFDEAAAAVDRFVTSSWEPDESLPEALYYTLMNVFPDEDVFPDAFEAPVVLAVEAEWIGEVRRLLADQNELARLWVEEE